MKILIIEDEIKLANAMKRALELASYVVDVAHDGILGLDLALGEDFDLLILDVMLPGIDGIEICKRIRQAERSIPILMLTAKGQVTDKVMGLDIGADDYMVKPFSFEELFARIRALTRRPKKIEESVLKIHDVVLNPNTYQVKRSEKVINLSAKEFSLLEYLIRNKNKVVSRDQIIAHVWDYAADILPSTVEVHIKHLRDKVDASFTPVLIHTVRGRGYTIREE